MAKILLFGVQDFMSCTPEMEYAIASLVAQGHEFIVGDNNKLDAGIHRTLSRLGAKDKATVYAMNRARSNVYEMPEKVFGVAYDSDNKKAIIIDKSTNEELLIIEGIEKEENIIDNRQYYEFIDRKMISDCDLALCLWDSENKRVFKCIQLLGIQNKQCYVYNF